MAWGCDEPAPQPWGDIDCVECGGQDGIGCGACGQTGRMPIDRCPFVLVRSPERLACDAVELASLGVLPCAGGWYEQPATLLDAIRLLLGERERYAREKRKREGGG